MLTFFVTMAAARAGDVVPTLGWADLVGEPDKLERAAARVLDGTPTVVAAGDTLGDHWDLVDHLMQHPNELHPPMLDGLADALTAEQAARAGESVFVAVPYTGRERILLVWRWDAEARRLVKVSARFRGE